MSSDFELKHDLSTFFLYIEINDTEFIPIILWNEIKFIKLDRIRHWMNVSNSENTLEIFVECSFFARL